MGSQGRGSRQAPRGRNWSREHARMLLMLHDQLCLHPYTTPDHPAQGWHHPQWAGPFHINQQSGKDPHQHARRQCKESNSSVEISSSQIRLDLCRDLLRQCSGDEFPGATRLSSLKQGWQSHSCTCMAASCHAYGDFSKNKCSWTLSSQLVT